MAAIPQLRCDMIHSYVCHDSFICVPWLVFVEVTLGILIARAWYDSSVCVSMLVLQKRVMAHKWTSHGTYDSSWYDSSVCVSMTCICGTDIADATSKIWRDSFTFDFVISRWPFLCVPWFVRVCPWLVFAKQTLRSHIYGVTWLIRMFSSWWLKHPLYVCHDLFMCVSMTFICAADIAEATFMVWHDSFICVPWLFHVWLVQITIHSYVIHSHLSFMCHSFNSFMCDSLIHVWLIQITYACGQITPSSESRSNHSRVPHSFMLMCDSLIHSVTHSNWLIHAYLRVTHSIPDSFNVWLIQLSHVWLTHSYVTHSDYSSMRDSVNSFMRHSRIAFELPFHV